VRAVRDRVAHVGRRRMARVVRAALAAAADRAHPRRRRIRDERPELPEGPERVHARVPRPDLRAVAVDELHRLGREGGARARQVHRRREVGLLGERSCRNGRADRRRHHAAAAIDDRPHRDDRVEPVLDVGAAPAGAQPSRRRDQRPGQRRGHDRLQHRRQARRPAEEVDRRRLHLHGRGQLYRAALLPRSERDAAGQRRVAIRHRGRAPRADLAREPAALLRELRERDVCHFHRQHVSAAARERQPPFLSGRNGQGRPRHGREPGGAAGLPDVGGLQPLTIDRLETRTPPTSKGGYNITSEFPNVFEADLRTAGTDYSGWLEPYMTVPPSGYRPPEVLKMELSLAQQITAGKTNVYDIATAIQNYFRQNFRYTLNPGNPPPGTDRMDYFLNTTKAGYCEYFATAMGDMLRLLGIPARLVNGFGGGTFRADQNRNVVTASDAHTWVEVYFPGYGWIPFEPTPDPNYSPITRGRSDTTNICINDNLCPGNTTGNTGTGNPRGNPETGRPGGNQGDATGTGGSNGGFKF